MGALKEPKAPVGSHRATAPRAVSFEGWASAAAAGTPGPAPGPCRTQDGHDHVTPQDLDGAPGDEVEGCEQVPGVHQRVSGRCVRRLELQARARRQPLVAPRKGLQCCSSERFRCRQMSACRHSGKPFSTWGRGAAQDALSWESTPTPHLGEPAGSTRTSRIYQRKALGVHASSTPPPCRLCTLGTTPPCFHLHLLVCEAWRPSPAWGCPVDQPRITQSLPQSENLPRK